MGALNIVVGVSGGVDSAVTALLLKQAGHQVQGVYMKNWEDDDEGGECPAAEDIEYAHQICEKLDIPFHTVNFSREYWDNVFEDFLSEYRAGRTPNPDVLCNREIKFKAFLNYAQSLGADKIATGHYANITKINDRAYLTKGLDNNKDQTYFLYQLKEVQLKQSLFPIGNIDKSKVRRLAEDAGFHNYNRKDSTGVCFIGERKFKPFLQRYLKDTAGEIVSDSGERLGQHDGLMFYTIGQRQGLNIGGQKGKDEAPWYVAAKNPQTNELIVVQGDKHPLLYKETVKAEQVTWITDSPKSIPYQCKAKIRYRQVEEACTIEQLSEKHCIVSFDDAQRAVSPGQSIVFYDGNICLGGGIITE